MGKEDGVSRNQKLQIGKSSGSFIPENGLLNYDGEKVQCHICRQWYVSLDSHARQAHHIPEEEYRKEFGLNSKTPLITPQLSQRRHQAAKRQFPSHTPPALVSNQGRFPWGGWGSIGSKRELRAEGRRTQSLLHKGKRPSEETRVKLRARHRPQSLETRQKISQTEKLTKARKRLGKALGLDHCPVTREWETDEQAQARFMARYPQARTCPEGVAARAPWALKTAE